MKLVTARSKTHNQTQTNINNIKTISSRFWEPDSNGLIRRPLLMGFMTGLFAVGIAATAYASHSLGTLQMSNDTLSDDKSVVSGLDTGYAGGATETQENQDLQINPSAENESSAVQSIENTSEGSRTSIRIEAHSESSTQDGSQVAEPEITINGQSVEIPENGRLREDYRDDNTRTRIRADIDSGSNTSISISTNETVELESE